MARVKTTSRRRPSDGGRSVCGPSDGGRGSKDESLGKDIPNHEGNTGDESVGKDVPNREGNRGDESVGDYIAGFVIRRPSRSKKNTLAGRDKGPLRTCNSTPSKPTGKKKTNREGNTEDEFVEKDVPTILEEEAEEEYNPHKRCRVSKSTPSKPAGKKKTNREGNTEEEEAEEEYNPHKRCRVSKSTPSKPAGKKETIVRCRPAALINLFKKLSTQQKDAVCSIGFGSLFELKLEEFPRDMIRMLCRNFCPKDKVLMIGNHRVQLKPADVADVFGIPMGKFKIPISKRDDDTKLKNFWLENYAHSSGIVTPASMRMLMEMDDDFLSGNDDFKRCFVMFAIITLLAPSLNTQADFKIVRALIDVNRIKEYDWCSYVLEDLATRMQKYEDSKTYIGGCVLLLQICYVQRLKFQGLSSPKSLPLIQHWTTKKLKERITLEAGKYGVGLLEGGYPITLDTRIEVLEDDGEGEHEDGDGDGDGDKGEDEHENEDGENDENVIKNMDGQVDDNAIHGRRRCETFDLPDGVFSNQDIEAMARNDDEKDLLLLKRNAKLFAHLCEQNINRLNHSGSFSLNSYPELSDCIQQVRNIVANLQLHPTTHGA
ncbi:uncharacterized protein LOC104900092 isoform X1 [Beta vulgaris subsp. vulgaris]|uniref:uncharacterized protein LOC104900092 isoform X1 n=1 Tax=Beta vulgaris subsp. vulgaris TaxID=3555 RepID=UPI002036BF31|nr:uncharacterized protein LOC104900092 isoform X1 [Beta vulgaris subsp. vulgaris]